MVDAAEIIREFEAITGFEPRPTIEQLEVLRAFCGGMSACEPVPEEERKIRLLSLINKKLKLNAEPLNDFFSACAGKRVFFNSPQKDKISEAFNRNDLDRLLNMADEFPSLSREFVAAVYLALSPDQTLRALTAEIKNTVNKRTKQPDSTLTQPLLRSLLGGFIYSYFDERDVHHYFDPLPDEQDYERSYWRRLHTHASSLFNRENTLSILRTSDFAERNSYDELRDRVFEKVRESYSEIANHGYLVLIIEPSTSPADDAQWRLCEDVKLFAEKHRSSALQKAYFQHRKISETTRDYISEIDIEKARFELANEGFSYKDTLVTYAGNGKSERPTLVVLFQRNERDETTLPCPACRSHDVQGNSYPTFGVKSWECQNWICPDRSMSDRGKRFSFLSLLMKQAIDDDNALSSKLVRKWSRDVVYNVTLLDILGMLIEFFSLHRDSITVSKSLGLPSKYKGRMVRAVEPRIECSDGSQISARFFQDPFFHRFAVARQLEAVTKKPVNLGDHRHKIYCGDAFDVLAHVEPGSVDGAVTSPPYYNAREYSQWSNIYGYMYDMFNISRAVFRVLKPGSFYLYNIFDYFDNERSIALSAMGQKRLILSAMTVDVFRRAGFEMRGNIVWDKGEIEGKRGFNGGNFSPYYQTPFNCWEHILVFRKPGPGHIIQFPTVLRQTAVIKMRNGVNVHGHTAPFPDAIPELLISQLPSDSVVLDPFAGSLTTGRVAERYGCIGLSVEKSPEYCQLGIALRVEEEPFTAARY